MQRLAKLSTGVIAGVLALLSIAPPPARSADTTVRVGILNITSDAPLLVADREGFFKQEGLDVVFTTFASAGNMIVPLGSNQLDVGGGAPAVGIYNGVEHGINVRIVADKGSDTMGYGFDKLMVRKELITSGRYRSPKDLRGLTIAGNQPGSVSASALYELLKKYGLKFTDVKRVNLDYPSHAAALANGKVDASITAEPEATQAERIGAAVKVMGDDHWYPNQQLSCLIYSNDFMKNRTDVAHKFMRAYLKGLRFYYDSLKDGHYAGKNGESVITLLTQATTLKDRTIYRELTPAGVNPDGRLNLDSMRKDLQFFRDQGLIEGKVRVEDVIDESFLNSAIAELGTYKNPKRAK